ncbi:UDP-glycosyltransferase 73C3 [Platanthera guangdongensis]|uniref:UDP-glycosyltransferase 73C3 n=1 Tax=Platanthera guangdongensis TaxID=2320717 RepID=A0ABR2M6Y6_9ASPA
MRVVGNNIRLHGPSFSGAEEPFLVAGIPHSVKLTRSQLPEFVISPSDIMALISASFIESYGLVMNTFYELEPAYADYSKSNGFSYWNVGPVSLCRRSFEILSARGGRSAGTEVFGWLDGKEAGSVLYVCFGSLPRFTMAQFGLIRDGLKAAGRPFVWVVRDDPATEGILAAGGEEGGFVIKGWAPQVAILMHEAVGGFMTHCGWNSCLEGIAAGVPMVTWPLFADQCFNERLLVDVLDLAVDVGSTVNSLREEERTLVVAERVTAAVEAIMGEGAEAEGRRERAKLMRKLAEAAVAEGGSSEVGLGLMVEELVALKIARTKEATETRAISA